MSDPDVINVCDVLIHGRCDRCDHPCPEYFTDSMFFRDESGEEFVWLAHPDDDDFEDDRAGQAIGSQEV